MTQRTFDLDGNERKLSPQCRSILNSLREKPMTRLEILNELDIMASTGRVSDLRQAGFNVRTEMIIVPSGKRVARYSIDE